MNHKKMINKLALILMGVMILPAFTLADIKMGVILGFTGPIESLTPDMGGSAEVAFKEVVELERDHILERTWPSPGPPMKHVLNIECSGRSEVMPWECRQFQRRSWQATWK